MAYKSAESRLEGYKLTTNILTCACIPDIFVLVDIDLVKLLRV